VLNVRPVVAAISGTTLNDIAGEVHIDTVFEAIGMSMKYAGLGTAYTHPTDPESTVIFTVTAMPAARRKLQGKKNVSYYTVYDLERNVG
jgi:hypothetical protein